jgi:hypothetical protein
MHGTHLSSYLEIASFQLPMVGLADLREDTTLLTVIYQMRAGVLIQKL